MSTRVCSVLRLRRTPRGSDAAVPGRARCRRPAGRTIYEWQQSLNEVEIFINAPEGVKASMIECEITMERLKLGLRGNPPFIDVSYFHVAAASRQQPPRPRPPAHYAEPDRRSGFPRRSSRGIASGPWVRPQKPAASLGAALTRRVRPEDGEIQVMLQKMTKGSTWPCALAGHGGVRAAAASRPPAEQGLSTRLAAAFSAPDERA